MSSTSRGGQRSPADNYPTPAWCVRRFAERFRLPGSRWLEPCVGDGAICRALAQAGQKPSAGWTMVDIRPECEELVQDISGEFTPGDFIDHAAIEFPRWSTSFDVAITNPPFSLALPILQACLRVSKITILLLRLNWLGSEERHSILAANPPDLYIHASPVPSTNVLFSRTYAPRSKSYAIRLTPPGSGLD